MRQPKNTAMEDKLGAALSKSKSGLSTKRQKSPELVQRETSVRRRFGHKSNTVETAATALLEVPIVEHNPSPEAIDAALESVQTLCQVENSTTLPSLPVEPSPKDVEEDASSTGATPFQPYISIMLSKLKDARNIVACDLEQTNHRLEKYQTVLRAAQRDVDSTEFSVLTLGEKLEKIDKNIEECKRLDGMSLEIASLIPHGTHHKIPTSSTGRPRPASDDPSICRKPDVLAAFQHDPKRNWSAREIVESLPAVKRHNAKMNVPSHLSVLAGEGKIVRVTTGVYTLACSEQ